MRHIVLVRIDDRLIHGQVVTAWIKQTDGNRILIVDDKLVNDRMMQRVLKAAAPPGISIEVKTILESSDLLKQDPEPKENIIILVKTPEVLESLIEQGVEIKKIILGGMGLTGSRKRFNKNVAITDEEAACIKRIIAKGIVMEFQLVPEESAVNVEKLF
ncbi:MAG: PTS sugar transporter subunit IIB [Treponema sp.]|jgi:PTS system mannose-specific IIB component|nr:PTS sugar transporter subunit IIB [Treponema sp.]